MKPPELGVPFQVFPVQVRAPVTMQLNTSVSGPATLWTGEGPPNTIMGAAVGDEYLDTLTGLLYRLDPGA